MAATRVSQRGHAPRAAVYRALLDPRAVQRWMVPTGMTSRMHAFEPREGGAFRDMWTESQGEEDGLPAL